MIRINTNNHFVIVSCTARASVAFIKLPNKKINCNEYSNYLISSKEKAFEFFSSIDGKFQYAIVDVERKQEIDLIGIAKKTLSKTKVIPYKPNDITIEAADLLLERFDKNDVIVYGSGNLSYKIALKLLERNVNVYLAGRDEDKVNKLIDTLNLVKPRYTTVEAKKLNSVEVKADGIISFVSKEKVVKADFLKHLKSGGFAIDGGIGNYSEEFLQFADSKGISVLRLDVRISEDYFSYYVNNYINNNFFCNIMGTKVDQGIELVAGGIIGKEGSIIVDKIKNTTQVIGVANGYGGLKDEKRYSERDRRNILKAKKLLFSHK